jgi:hypothetical protein
MSEPKSKSLYQKLKATKPRWFVGKALTKTDVKEIEAMLKRIRAQQAELRDYRER